MAEEKPIGEVTHFFNNIGVAIVKFSKAVSVGDTIHFKGATTDFTHKIDSMQFDHEEIDKAKKGQEVGIKVGDRVRVGDQVF
jgi:translation initiation factor IF-2